MLDSPALARLGFSAHFQAAYASHPAATAHTRPARVCIEHRGRLVVLAGDDRLLAWPPEGARHESLDPEDILARPRVGDWVVLPVEESEPRILAVLPRRTVLLRQTPKKRVTVQVVAANLDRVLVVTALGPDISPRRLERFVAAVRASGARPELVVNKVDLADTPPSSPQDLLGAVVEDVPVWWTSAKTGLGIEALSASVEAGETLGLVGTSGAGKSSLINCLHGDSVQATFSVRDGDAKGRHTTTHRELVPLPGGGLLLDTPGMRELQLWDADGVTDTYADVADLAKGCRWRGCTHGREDGCAIQGAIRAKQLDRGRFLGWQKLAAETEATETRRKRAKRRRR
jgi:ribosome biogenesis GTPase